MTEVVMVGRCALILTVALAMTGCGVSQASLDDAQKLVQSSLEVWAKGGKPADLRGQARPVEIVEQLWSNGEALMSFEMGKTSYSSRDRMIRCEAKLTLRGRKGKPYVENVAYDVSLGPPVKIVNNPMP
ncbi:MAG: hypothetical protein U0840_26250 [Gemmataceae bacterium]